MSYTSNIQWTDSTWNPWYGCIKVAQGCKNCYMYRDFDRWHKDPMNVQRSKTRFNDPLTWADPRLIFTCSLSDFFIEQADPWRAEAWDIINKTPQHFYQILTKRPERIERCLPELDNYYRLKPINMIVMLSVSTQDDLEAGWPVMESIARHYGIRVGLSIEPLLEQIDLRHWLSNDLHFPDWVIVGGESGNKTGKYIARRCDPFWIFDIANQCVENHVPVFIKQLGSVTAREMGLKHPHGGDPDEWIYGHSCNGLRQMPDFMKLNLNKGDK